MSKKISVSIMIPGLNEAGNIENSVKIITQELEKCGIIDYELILVNDGSVDDTGKIMNGLKEKDQHIKVLHNPMPRGIGFNFRAGAALAVKDYMGWFPGDNETLPETMENIFEQIGSADAIVPYTINPRVRSIYRRLLSTAYTTLFNTIFGLKLRYFNGPCFFRSNLLKTVAMSTDGPAFMAEILVQLIKKNRISYVEVPMLIKVRDYGKTSVLKWKNVFLIAKTIVKTFWRVYFQN